MKTESMGCINLIGEKDLEELLQVTKETVAIHLKQDVADRSFGPVDMWNRQKKQRTTLQMRRWMN